MINTTNSMATIWLVICPRTPFMGLNGCGATRDIQSSQSIPSRNPLITDSTGAGWYRRHSRDGWLVEGRVAFVTRFP